MTSLSHSSHKRSLPHSLATLVFLTSSIYMGTIAPAHAQEQAPNAEQTSLYQRAQLAYEEGDYEATIALLEAANAIQPFDLFTYNIARAHFRLKNCTEAKENYEQARLQPSLGPSLITQIRDGLDELNNVCTGTLQITCENPSQTTLSIDRGESLGCEETKPFELKPGAHMLTATLEDQSEMLPFEIRAMEVTTLAITLRPIPKPLSFASTSWGKRFTIVGGTLLGGAILLDQTLVRSRNNAYIAANEGSFRSSEIFEQKRQLRRSQALVLTMGAMGLVSTSIGVPLWVRGNISDEQFEVGFHTTF